MIEGWEGKYDGKWRGACWHSGSIAAEVVAAEGFDLLPLSARRAIRAGAYGREHRDPFPHARSAGDGGVAGAAVERWVAAKMGAEVVWGYSLNQQGEKGAAGLPVPEA